MRGWYHIHNLLLSSINHISFDPLGEHFSSFHFIFLLSQKQFFDVVPISATGFLPPESNATTTPTTTTPGITSGAASTTSPLNTGDVGGGKSGQQVCTVKAFYCKYYDHNKYQLEDFKISFDEHFFFSDNNSQGCELTESFG